MARTAILWRQVGGLAALLAAIIFSFMVYGYYQPKILAQLGFTTLATHLAIIQSLLGAIAEPLAGSLSDQEILREGEQIGEQRGRQEGMQEGRQEEGRSLILKLLTRRVGDLSPDEIARVEALSIEQLEALGEALLDFTQPDELTHWFERNA